MLSCAGCPSYTRAAGACQLTEQLPNISAQDQQ